MRVHTAWLEAAIEAVPALALAVYVTIAENRDGSPVEVPYVVIHPMDGQDDTDRLTGPNATQNPRFTVHSIGLTYEQAAWAAEQVKAVVMVNGLGVVPTVSGERSERVWYSVPQPVQTDKTVTPNLLYHTAECGWESNPA